MRKIGKIFMITMILSMATMTTPASAASIEAYVNNTAVIFDTPPVMVADRTLVPARAIFEALGGEISWNETTRTVGITIKDAEKEAKTIDLIIDSNAAKVNQKDVKMTVPAQIMNGRTMVPLRFVSENCGYHVHWDEGTQRIDITTMDAASQESLFTSKSGVKITANQTWQVGNADQVYVNDQKQSDLVLIKDGQGFFTIDCVDESEEMATFKDTYDRTKDVVKTAGQDKAIAALKAAKYSPEGIAIFQAAWEHESVNSDAVFLQIKNASWLAQLKTAYPDFVLVSQEDVQVLGQKAKLMAYKYTEASGVVLHNYEVSMLDGTKHYTFSAWTTEADFVALQAELKTMITKATK